MFKKIFLLTFIGLSISCNSKKKELTQDQKTIINEAKENFVFVNGGTFIMGKDGVSTVYKATIDNYSLSKYETTFKEFDLYTEHSGLNKIIPDWRSDNKFSPKHPVEFINWYQAENYCKWLGMQLNLPIILPTDAQWEYAARSRGKNVEHATNNGKIEGSYTVKRNYPVNDTIVGSYPPNPLGLYDMSGGRPEWVYDWYLGYIEGPKINPRQDSIVNNRKKKVLRGIHSLQNSVYIRLARKPNESGFGGGFRCACNKKTPIN